MRLADIEGPLEDVEFPNGAVRKPVPFGPTEYKLWREIQQETDALKRGTMLMQIVTACYPTATPDDLDSCTPKMLIAMAAHAGRKIEQIRDALKNVDAAAVAKQEEPLPPPTPPSSPRTNGGTSVSKSRRRSHKTSGTSTSATLTVSPT